MYNRYCEIVHSSSLHLISLEWGLSRTCSYPSLFNLFEKVFKVRFHHSLWESLQALVKIHCYIWERHLRHTLPGKINSTIFLVYWRRNKAKVHPMRGCLCTLWVQTGGFGVWHTQVQTPPLSFINAETLRKISQDFWASFSQECKTKQDKTKKTPARLTSQGLNIRETVYFPSAGYCIWSIDGCIFIISLAGIYKTVPPWEFLRLTKILQLI